MQIVEKENRSMLRKEPQRKSQQHQMHAGISRVWEVTQFIWQVHGYPLSPSRTTMTHLMLQRMCAISCKRRLRIACQKAYCATCMVVRKVWANKVVSLQLTEKTQSIVACVARVLPHKACENSQQVVKSASSKAGGDHPLSPTKRC